MQTYPYQGRNLFQLPETYEYAQCEGEVFIDAWRRYREEAIMRIKREASDRRPASMPVQAALPGAVVLRATLEEVLQNIQDEKISPQCKSVVHKLLKKFEIARRLFSVYSPELTRIPDVPLATLAEYLMFARILTVYAERFDNPLYLSTLLKLDDALCSLPGSEFEQRQADEMRLILEEERRLVGMWERRVPK